MVSQLLFGDTYTVLQEAENGKWWKIETDEDQYQGWIDKKLHLAVSESYFNSKAEIRKHFCAEVVGYVDVEGTKQPIFFGSYLPHFDGNHVYFDNKRFPFVGKADKIEKDTLNRNIVYTAHSFLSTPYLWGGKSHAGIDCSGLVQMVFRSCGHSVLRDAYQQASMGTSVENLEEAKSGDLAFFSGDSGKITHVGILTSPKEIIHAHGKVRADKIDSTGIINGDSGLYSHKLTCIRRLMD
jgi:hypothetical protein